MLMDPYLQDVLFFIIIIHYDVAWCRPQNDGPALTVSTMVRFAQAYLANGGSLDRVRTQIYGPWMPANTLVKVYMEYISSKWQDMNTCDLVIHTCNFH